MLIDGNNTSSYLCSLKQRMCTNAHLQEPRFHAIGRDTVNPSTIHGFKKAEVVKYDQICEMEMEMQPTIDDVVR